MFVGVCAGHSAGLQFVAGGACQEPFVQVTTERQAIGIWSPYEQERPGTVHAPLGWVAGHGKLLPLLLELEVELELEDEPLAPPAPLDEVVEAWEVVSTEPPQLIAAIASAAQPRSQCSFFMK